MTISHVGRPTGSTTGRVPIEGYPPVDDQTCAFLAGFIEGEGSFNIGKQSQGTNHSCLMTLAARDDDAGLLGELQAATGLGRLNRRAARRTSNPQVAWTILAKSDCLRLIELLDIAPLRGRKAHDYALWRAAVRSWVGPGASVYRKSRDWEGIRYLKARLESERRYDPARPPYRLFEAADPVSDWPAYFAGLLTADGTIGISMNGRAFTPRVQILLRRDDLPLIEEIRHQLGVGRVYLSHPAPRAPSGGACWMVRDRAGLLRVLGWLDSFPPRGRMGKLFPLWAAAVRLHASAEPSKRRISGLRELRASLAEARQYSPRAALT